MLQEGTDEEVILFSGALGGGAVLVLV